MEKAKSKYIIYENTAGDTFVAEILKAPETTFDDQHYCYVPAADSKVFIPKRSFVEKISKEEYIKRATKDRLVGTKNCYDILFEDNCQQNE